MAEAFDFVREAKSLLDPRLELGASQIQIWGGELVASESESVDQVLARFLALWDDPARKMPWSIWEYADSIEFKKGKATRLSLLERGRVFGRGGDLSVRRDGSRVLWHFIGKAWQLPPTGIALSDFWQAHPNLRLRWRRERGLLWGDYKAALGHWQDDRVGHAVLSYPVNSTVVMKPGQRMMIEYIALTDGGQIAFVWWRQPKEAK